MKRILTLLPALFVLGALAAPAQDFRMMIRLWPAHHNDSTLTEQLLEAFRKYDFCDEVWLCSDGPATHAVSWHEPSARRMGLAADKIRAAGIIPSLQVVALGHGDGTVANTPAKDSTIHWGTMTGPNGEVTASVNCPRQKEYLRNIEEAFKPYVEAVHPHSIYLDDDLRMTSHSPAPMGCYCDTCISLFNKQFGYSFDRPSLVEALLSNKDGGQVRSNWIAFGQESLAGIVRAVSRGVHAVSPETRIGLQHASFHRQLLEGWDWNPMFRAMKEETGLDPVSRPGHGFYNDHSPRGMVEKGLELSRQIRRLEPGITEISPEIEGYVHKATGKSPRSICLETMYYLSMGATQMSYAIICGNEEPVSWYADNYFKALSEWKPFAKEYAEFNKGTMPHGIDPYFSRDLALRDVEAGEDPWAWTTTSTGTAAYTLETLGIPFAPEDPSSPVLMLDGEGVKGMGDKELTSLLASRNIVMDSPAWSRLEKRGLATGFVPAEVPARYVGDYDNPAITQGGRYSDAVNGFRYLERNGVRIVVVPSFTLDLLYSKSYNGAWRLALLHAFDWASDNALPAVMESFAQTAVVPRADQDGRLRSVALLNCSISEVDSFTLRLRPGTSENNRKPKFVWKKQGCRDKVLKAERDGSDYILEVPSLEGWNFGWIAVK